MISLPISNALTWDTCTVGGSLKNWIVYLRCILMIFKQTILETQNMIYAFSKHSYF